VKYHLEIKLEIDAHILLSIKFV